ncbi:hypothetical protein DENIS_3835 [Desulfonema ishimotonii]|uniref:Uncharacterized protein n=1 Tax=Desulfonema ishimotonii TaxID=45657 RepID=A0A401G0W2_9BACT|nr:hypothetical protein DENIS_3835 [Desulfonema ishimotonii]
MEIPWESPGEWQGVNTALAGQVQRFGAELETGSRRAREIQALLATLFPLMDELCAGTCPACAAPCCEVAVIWYNYADLLFLHLNGLRGPEAQPMTDSDAMCRYSGARGCTLPRMVRPWICTWYVCPPQMAMVREKGRAFRENFDRVVGEIKSKRKEMADIFVRVTSGSGSDI